VERNSGRGKFELHDMRLGGRGVGVSIDLKETRAASYGVKLATMRKGAKRAQTQGYEFGLKIEFNDEAGKLLGEYAVIPYAVYDELLSVYNEVTNSK